MRPGIRHSLAFERFLKYYHLLELNFDFDLIRRIKNLDPVTESKSISMLLNEYRREDIERLKYILKHVLHGRGFADRSNESTYSIFMEFRKLCFMISGKNQSSQGYWAVQRNIVETWWVLHTSTAKRFLASNSTDSHRRFICSLCAYWIYRIRNSIAHKKIGEYIMTNNDEQFVLDFGEPLLLTVLRQVFK